MFETLDIFQLSAARARHAAERQNVVARNIANADTPGYRAQDVAAFEDVFRMIDHGGDIQHLDFSRRIDAGGPTSPNGNSVALEMEMMRGVDAQRTHSRALMIYQSSMNVLRTSLGR